MKVTFNKTSDGSELRNSISGGYEVVSNLYNLFVAKQMSEDGVTAGETFEKDGAIIRQFSNNTEIRLYP